MQALKSYKRKLNDQSMAAARNTLMLYDVNKDPKKDTGEITIAHFLPFPDIWHEDNTTLSLELSPTTARRILNGYAELPAFAKFAISELLNELRIIARK